MKNIAITTAVPLILVCGANAFSKSNLATSSHPKSRICSTRNDNVEAMDELVMKREKQKAALKSILGVRNVNSGEGDVVYDSVLACPLTKDPVSIQYGSSGFISTFDQGKRSGLKVKLETGKGVDGLVYEGRTDSYFDLLNPVTQEIEEKDSESVSTSDVVNSALNAARVFVPPPLRTFLPGDEEYIPKRDLFTSPAVSFAYERGWRQGFAAAGFPGELFHDFGYLWAYF